MRNFYTITNKEIYCKIIDIEKKLDRQNRKITIAVWTASTALTLSLIVIGVIVKWP